MITGRIFATMFFRNEFLWRYYNSEFSCFQPKRLPWNHKIA